MNAVSLEVAQAHLPDLIERLQPGEEVEITKGSRTVARLVSSRPQRVFGLGKGKLIIQKDDDEHLKDFGEYLP
jgi:antitoxin (DNA-binding transcriptional repressor) of toxin-antitoxin stability system